MFFARERGTGFLDAAGLPWDQAKRAQEILDPSGGICFKVEALRLQKAP